MKEIQKRIFVIIVHIGFNLKPCLYQNDVTYVLYLHPHMTASSLNKLLKKLLLSIHK
jgi:hypothetical protein